MNWKAMFSMYQIISILQAFCCRKKIECFTRHPPFLQKTALISVGMKGMMMMHVIGIELFRN
jgi:hypothetical protein